MIELDEDNIDNLKNFDEENKNKKETSDDVAKSADELEVKTPIQDAEDNTNHSTKM